MSIRLLITICLAQCLLALPLRADHRIGDICRIKGQEENILQGIGLVTGLKGTGDGDMKTTTRALSHYMEVLGHRIGTSATGQPMLEELKGAKNVALVFITATVPAGGAQQGDSLDCVISAFGAKSLDGGHLMLTEMYGPIPGDKTVYGLARGLVSIDDIARPQIGRILLGCQVEKKVENKFIENGKLILVMHKDHAAFQTTADLEMAINREQDFTLGKTGQGVAKAIDQVRIEVTIPPSYIDNPPLFAARLLDTRFNPPPVDTRVIINERKQVIVVGAEVEIGAVAVMHKNRLIQIGNDPGVNQAVAFDLKGDATKTRLASLVDALNELKVPTTDVIDIIKLLKHKRALFGELIIE